MNKIVLQLIDNIYKVTKRAPLKIVKKIGEKSYEIKDNYIFHLLDNLAIQEQYSLVPPSLFENLLN